MINEFSAILQCRLSRRSTLKMGASISAMTAFSSPRLYAMGNSLPQAEASAPFNLSFASVAKDYTADLTVTSGYDAGILMRWGDAVLATPKNATPSQTQAASFGYNNDFIAYLPLNGSSSHGLLRYRDDFRVYQDFFG